MSQPSDTNAYTVTAVIPAYNAEKYIARAIDSVLAQTHQPDEIIVVDDGSTDATAEIIKRYTPQVQYIYQENAGGSIARNTAIEAAKSEWVAFLDADDEWLGQKLQLQIEHLKRNGDLAWSYTNFTVHYLKDDSQKLSHEPAAGAMLLNEKEYFETYFAAFLAGCPTSTITVIVKRDAIIQAGMFLPGQKWAQDADLAWRMAYRWPEIGYLPRPLSINHFGTPGSITEENRYLVPQRCDFIDRHLKLAAENNRLDEFQPCAVKYLTAWLYSILRENPSANVSEMLNRFSGILPKRLLLQMRLRMASPRLAGPVIKAWFWLKDVFRKNTPG
jgi:glycosyltransferase involved in cell wall biosynthesis